MVKVMFVCLGNICRSPAAEGILKHMISNQGLNEHIEAVDSSGLGDWHIGHSPDERMRKAAEGRGLQLVGRAQKFKPEFLDEYDYILGADKEVMQGLYSLAKTPEHLSKLALMTEFSGGYQGQDVPDPYYGGDRMFEVVLEMLEDSCQGLINKIKEK